MTNASRVLSLLTVAALAGLSPKSEAYVANLRLNPVTLLVGYVQADLDIAIGSKFTLGPSFTYWSLSVGEARISTIGYGVRANVFFNANFTDGWYVGPYFNHTSKLEVELEGDSGTLENINAYGAYVGYHWFWPSGFNLNLGLGPQFVSSDDSDDSVITDDSGDRTDLKDFSRSGLAGEFSLGWAF